MSPAPPALDPNGPFPQEFGRYQVLRALGRGGMATVYLAHDRVLQRQVALKTPHAHLVARPTILERFYHEARAAAALYHPNLCPVFDVGEHAGTHYLTMPFIEGTPLSEGPPTEQRAIAELVRKLALAVAAAHRQQVVHRDLKLANVLLTSAGEPMVMDFGVALRMDADAERLTGEGGYLGTLAYMAPEQLRGDRDAVGPAVDVYALGVILYKLWTRQVPFSDRDPDVLRDQILHDEPPPPAKLRPGLDARLAQLCLRCLAKAPADRPASAEAVAAALTEHLGPAQPAAAAGPRPLVRPEAIRFAFAGLGSAAPPGGALQDRVYLDVGNDLRPGVLDHHHLTAYAGSTARLVLTYPALLDGAVAPGRKPDAPFTIVLHEKPDLDSVAAAFLAVAYLSTRAFPEGAEALARYADRIDQGALGLTQANPGALYPAYLQFVNRLLRQAWNSDHERWRASVQQGVRVVGYVLQQMAARGKALPEVDALACPGVFVPEDRQEVLADAERYRRKLADPATHARRVTLHLPGEFGGTVAVPALLVRGVQDAGDPERCVYFKDWARGEGLVALSVFMEQNAHQARRCILSVTPHGGATLRGLGALLDQAEAQRRTETYGADDRVVDRTTGQPRPPRPGYANADPWYDGRGHGGTVVDAPQSGTLLRADEIEAIFLRFGGAGLQ